MRIAALFYLAPRKLGSLEQWIMEFVTECHRRGHSVHLFCAMPIHPVVEKHLKAHGVPQTPFEVLERRPVRSANWLRKSFDLIYMNLVVPRSRGAYAGYLAWPLPVLFFDGISGSMPGQRATSWLGRLVDPAMFRRVTALAACSHYVLQRDLRRFGLDPARCSVIYNGIDTSRFLPRPPEDASRLVTIGTVARLIPEKGINVLIEACAQIQDLPWRLIIVGDGVERENLESLVAARGLAGRTQFFGLRDDVEEFLRATDINVHPCLWEEAFGLTIAEAMACGCATVASRVGGIPEIIRHGRSGLLIERGDVAALAQALRDLLVDGEWRRELGVEAREQVLAKFGLRAAVDLQVDWIEKWAALSEKRDRRGNDR